MGHQWFTEADMKQTETQRLDDRLQKLAFEVLPAQRFLCGRVHRGRRASRGTTGLWRPT